MGADEDRLGTWMTPPFWREREMAAADQDERTVKECDRCRKPFLGGDGILIGAEHPTSVTHEGLAICDAWIRAKSLEETATEIREAFGSPGGEVTDLQERLDRALDHIETLYSLASQGRKPPEEVEGDPSPYLKDLREFMATQGRSLT